MPNRDYAARQKKSGKSVNKLLILIIVLLLLGASALALMLLKSKEPVASTQVVTNMQTPKSELPTPPAEIYSYIRDLETREVPIDKNTKTVQLTKEQELQLQRKREEEQRRQEVANQKIAQQQAIQQQAQQAQIEQPIVVSNENTQSESVVAETAISNEEPIQPVVKAITAEELAARKAAEEKRKLAELRKQQETKKAEVALQKQAQLKSQQEQAAKLKEQQAREQLAKEQAAKVAEQQKLAAEQQAKAEAAKKAKEAQQKQKVVAKAATEAPKVVGKFGLQCGAFKNKAQAENMQARLAMAGFNARIASNGEWNRVFVGPVGDRAAASRAQANARSVSECLIVGM